MFKLILRLLLLINIVSVALFANADVEIISSPEIGNTSIVARAGTENLKATWERAVSDAGACPLSFTTGSFNSSIPITFEPASTNNDALSTSISGVQVTVGNRNMVNINGGTFADRSGSPGGSIVTSSSATLQGTSPRPTNLFDTVSQPLFWNDLSGSNLSRNAALFRFDTPVRAFGAWFGDLETSPLGTEAIVRLFDNTGNQIGSDQSIGYDNDWLVANSSNLAACGGITGCGNGTTRFIGFIADPTTPVSYMLVVVGDDDSGGTGNLEGISIIGPRINNDFSCTSVDLVVDKFAALSPIVSGTDLEYYVYVSNNSDFYAEDVVLTDILPAGSSFVSATPSSAATCLETLGTINCDLGILEPGEVVSVVIRATPTTSGTYLNSASVVTSTSEADFGNDSDQASIEVYDPIIVGSCPDASDPDLDSDDDGVSDSEESTDGTAPCDADTDNDGLSDGQEKSLGTNPLACDTDGDLLSDGLELGVNSLVAGGLTDVSSGIFLGTDPSVCFSIDLDPTSTTNPLSLDTDSGGVNDGIEDHNQNGRLDPNEINPDVAVDDSVPASGCLEDLTITAANVDNLFSELTTKSAAQAFRSAKRLANKGLCKRVKNRAQIQQELQNIMIEAWTKIWSDLPRSSYTCEATLASCLAVDTNSTTDRLINLAEEASYKLNRVLNFCRTRNSRQAYQIKQSANNLTRGILKYVKQGYPNNITSCE